jgi:chorismate mutase
MRVSVETTFPRVLRFIRADTLRRMADAALDPTIRRYREAIAEVDRAIVEAVNDRLELVAELKRYKAEQGIAFVDPARERELVDTLVAANRGPLSSDALRELFASLLELTKREVARGEAPPG